MAEGANFEDIVNEDILLEIDKKKVVSKGISKETKLNQKQRQEGDWHDKYFVHGILSDIIADVKNQTHGCINSSVSEDIDISLAILQDINIKANAILNARVSKISTREQQIIDQFIQQRTVLIAEVLNKGILYTNQYEQHYRRLIQEFITKLEIEMSKHLDELQKSTEAEKQSIFIESYNSIRFLTDKAEKARSDVHRFLQQAVAKKRDEIMGMIKARSDDTTNQPLGYEQLRKLNVELYSTVGLKKAGHVCENIGERGRFVEDIDKVKPPQPRTKRTIYIENDVGQQQTNRNNHS